MLEITKTTKRAAIVVSGILVAAFLLRVINLDADPSAFLSRDFITDEGWWAHNARNAVFYGQWKIDDLNQGLYSAYLYNLLLYFIFKLSGVSFTTLRLLSAVTGWATVVVLFFLVRREVNIRAAVFTTALLGFSNLHIIYSRTGFVETTIVFFLALTLWCWSLRRVNQLFSLASGVCFGLMILTKVTAVYVVPGFIVLILVERIRRSINLRETLLFSGGAILVGAVHI
ncbi:MAG: glycosyltransferase family 39 protein, partial [Blastocatellia bacterium]